MNVKNLSLLLTVVLCAHSFAGDLSPAYEVLWPGNEIIVAQEKKAQKRIEIFARDLHSISKIQLVNKSLVAYHLSPSEKMLALSFASSGGTFATQVFDTQTGVMLYDLDPTANLRSIFWLNACDIGVLSRKLDQAQLENKLEVFRIPEVVSKDRKIDCAANAQLKKKSLPVAFFTDEMSHWGVFNDASRKDFSWIGRGEFSGLKPGLYPFFYFVSGQTLFRARVDENKIQPIASNVVEYFPSEIENSVIILGADGSVKKLSSVSEKKVEQREEVIRASGVKELWAGPKAKWTLLKNDKNVFEMLDPR